MYSFQDSLSGNESNDEIETKICRLHNELFDSICFYQTCSLKKLCWKCKLEHQSHPGEEHEYQINITNLVQSIQKNQKSLDKIYSDLDYEINQGKKFYEKIMDQLRNMKELFMNQILNIEEKIAKIYESDIQSRGQKILDDINLINSIEFDDKITNDNLIQMMIDFKRTPSLFQDMIRELKHKQQQYEIGIEEIIKKAESSMRPFLMIHKDVEIYEPKNPFEGSRRKNSPVGNLNMDGDLIGHENVCKSSILLNDGDLATGSRDKTIRIWCGQTQQCKQIIKDHNNWVQDLHNLPGDNFCSCSDDKKIKIFSKFCSQWQSILTLVGHQSYVMRAIYNTELNIIISCSTDGTIKLWKFTQPFEQIIEELRKQDSLNQNDYFTSQTLEGHENSVYSLAINKYLPSQDMILSGDEGGEIIKWSINQKKLVAQNQEAHVGCVNALHITQSNNIISAGDDKTIKIWSTQLKETLNIIHLQRSEIESFVMINENILLCGDEQGYLVLLSIDMSSIIFEVCAHKDRIYRIQYDKKNNKICTASADCSSQIWSLV